MRVLKSIVAGLVALLIGASILLGVVAGAALTSQWNSAYGVGSGGIGTVSVGISEAWVMLLSLLFFAAGFRWRYKRGGQDQRPKDQGLL